MPLAFWEAVAVGVVSGLIVLAIGALATWAVQRRGRHQREQAQRYIDRAPLRAGLVAVAPELRANADIAERCEQGQGHVPSEVAPLGVIEWRDRRNEMMPLRDEDRALLDELEETWLRKLIRERGQRPKADPPDVDLNTLGQRQRAYVEALLREREGHVKRGLKDRVEQVEDQIIKAREEWWEKATDLRVALIDIRSELESARRVL